MQFFNISAWNTGKTLFSGQFNSWKQALETAIDQNVALDYALIEDADIGPANLDGGSFNYARFLRCTLDGANLSEASLIKAQFIGCGMKNVCLVDSVAVGARFQDTPMDGCEVDYADLRGIIVECAEFLKASFHNNTHLAGSAFHAHGTLCMMNRAPVFVRGIGLDVVLLDEHVVLGGGGVVLHRGQLGRDIDGMSETFTRHGIAPHGQALDRLWQFMRGGDIQTHEAA